MGMCISDCSPCLFLAACEHGHPHFHHQRTCGSSRPAGGPFIQQDKSAPVDPGHHTPTSPAAPHVPLPHVALRQLSHLLSPPVQLMLLSRGMPVPGPYTLPGTTVPTAPLFNCSGRQ